MHEHLHGLAQAAADNDAVAEELGIEETLKSIGLTPDDVRAVAEQRALRLVMAIAGKSPLQRSGFVNLSPSQQEQLVAYTTIYMDGIALGWRAANKASKA